MLKLNIQQQDAEETTTIPQAKKVIEPITADPFDLSRMDALFSHFKTKILEMKAEVNEVTVKDAASSAQASEMAAQARKLSNVIAKEQKRATAPYHEVKQFVDGLCKGLRDELSSIQNSAEAKNRSYLIEQERLRQEAAEKARREAEASRREAEEKAKAEAEAKAKELGVSPEEVALEPVAVAPVYIPPPQIKVETESGTQKIEFDMQWEIGDFRALPDECLQARAEQLKAAVAPWINAKKKAEIYNIPGVVFSKVQVVKTRAARN